VTASLLKSWVTLCGRDVEGFRSCCVGVLFSPSGSVRVCVCIVVRNSRPVITVHRSFMSVCAHESREPQPNVANPRAQVKPGRSQRFLCRPVLAAVLLVPAPFHRARTKEIRYSCRWRTRIRSLCSCASTLGCAIPAATRCRNWTSLCDTLSLSY
jgi:hypothetical protein